MEIDVLVIEPDEVAIEALERALRPPAGFRATVTRSGAEGVRALATGQFAVLVCPASMGDFEWLALLKLVRSGRYCSTETLIVVLCEPSEAAAYSAIADGRTFLFTDQNYERLGTYIEEAFLGLGSPRVLLVADDCAATSQLTASMNRFYKVDTAHNCERALSKYATNKPDLVILELMPMGLSGHDVYHSIRASSPKQPIILLTEHDSLDSHRDLVISGASEVLSKPVSVDKILSTCRRVLTEASVLARVEVTRRYEDLGRRVVEANISLKQGRASNAFAVLQDALAHHDLEPLSDDDWTCLTEQIQHK